MILDGSFTTDEMVIDAMEADLYHKVDLANVDLYRCFCLDQLRISYRLVDRETNHWRVVEMFEEEFVGLNRFGKAKAIYRRIMDEAQNLVNERKS